MRLLSKFKKVSLRPMREFGLALALASQMVAANAEHSGSVDLGFDTSVGTDGPVNALAAQKDGRVLVGGYFAHINGVARPQIARLELDGSVDSIFAPPPPVLPSGLLEHEVNAIRVQEDGRVVVVGRLTPLTPPNSSRFPSGRYYVVRYLTGGTVDPSFKVYLSETDTFRTPSIVSVLLRKSGQLFVAANFSRDQNPTTYQYDRLVFDSFGNIDPSFHPPSPLVAMNVELPNQGLVVGAFPGLLQSLGSDGTITRTVDVNALTGLNQVIMPVAAQSDGSVLYMDYPPKSLGRLLPDGTYDPGFSANQAKLGIQALGTLLVQPDDKIIISAALEAFPGPTYLIRLNVDGTLDESFARATIATWLSVYSLSLDHVGGVIVGGSFGALNGIPRNNLGRLLLASAPDPMELFSPSHPSGTFSVSFRTIPARQHTLEFRTSLRENDWTALPPVLGNGDVMTFKDVNPSDSQRLYRIRIE